MMHKTVYVLGAGFSFPAGAPDQAGLIDRALSLADTDAKTIKAQSEFRKFLIDVMNYSPADCSGIALEDVYTPIDRCLAEGLSLRGYPPSALEELRGQMEYLFSVAIDRSIDAKARADGNADKYVKQFATQLVNLAEIRAQKAKNQLSARNAKSYDPFSIISLNWDILLDKAIFRALMKKDRGQKGDYAPIGVVDYCCYISSIDEKERRIRSGLWTLGARGYNVKLLKLHGSMNWLQCSNCQRLFVSFNEKVNIPNFINAETCRHCHKYGVDATLRGSLVMPTFLKDLTNFQIKLVWQNAAVELMEARRLVFLGYSLPFADFEFRQLLSRMVHKDAEIQVVLYHDGSEAKMKQYDLEIARYQQFFGSRAVKADHYGVVEYVKRLNSSTNG